MHTYTYTIYISTYMYEGSKNIYIQFHSRGQGVLSSLEQGTTSFAIDFGWLYAPDVLALAANRTAKCTENIKGSKFIST